MITVKLSWHDLEILYHAHLQRNITGDNHNALLREHCFEFARLFDKLVCRGNKNYRVKFTSLQALAFTQIWTGAVLPPFAVYTILNIIGQIDQAHRNSRVYENDTRTFTAAARTGQITGAGQHVVGR